MNKIFWLWIPVAFIIVQIILETVLSPRTLGFLHSENGPHELLQFLVMVAGFIVALVTLFKMDIKANKWLAGWAGLAALCCLYVAGEEISWGQHFLDWTTPDFWNNYNDQQETNLHNVSSWLDQKPRLLLETGVLTGGIILPLLLRFKPALVPQKFNMIYPPSYLAVVAVLALLPKIIAKIAENYDIILFERVSEVQELYLFYFVLLYLLAFKGRVMKRA